VSVCHVSWMAAAASPEAPDVTGAFAIPEARDVPVALDVKSTLDVPGARNPGAWT